MSTFKPAIGPKSVHLDISAQDGASELLLVNGAYDLVVQAIGSISVDVPPGQYHVRQRIGDTEAIREFAVPENGTSQTLLLDPLRFPSPAPIIGNPEFQKLSPEDWQKPAELVGKPGIRLAIRAPELDAVDSLTETVLVRLNKEKACLRLETLEGTVICCFEDCAGNTDPVESGLFLLDLETAPGQYVLAQSQDDGRCRCLPLTVLPDWSPRVYLLCQQVSPRDADDTFIPVSLDNASIIYCPTSSGASPTQPDLIRVEAARKSLARGRSMGGYLRRMDGPAWSIEQNPMLALMDAHLILKDMKKSEMQQATEAIDAAAASLGESFPDVIALRYALASYSTHERKEVGETTPATADILMGPPILADSWRYLLASSQTCARLSDLMPLDFMPDSSGTWFIWSERQGIRQARTSTPPSGRSLAASPRASGDKALNLAASGLVALMQTGAVKGWVDTLAKLAAESKVSTGAEDTDPLLTRLIDGLMAIQNPLLQEAFGQHELARRVLLSFNLPSERLEDLLKVLSTTLDKHGLLRGLIGRSIVTIGDYLANAIKGLGRR